MSELKSPVWVIMIDSTLILINEHSTALKMCETSEGNTIISKLIAGLNLITQSVVIVHR